MEKWRKYWRRFPIRKKTSVEEANIEKTRHPVGMHRSVENAANNTHGIPLRMHPYGMRRRVENAHFLPSDASRRDALFSVGCIICRYHIPNGMTNNASFYK